MAFIGMMHPVVARLKNHVPGNEPTYEKGMIIGAARKGDLNITRNNNPLYGDDVVVEDDNGITAMSLSMETDDIEEAVRVYMLSLVEKTGEDSGGVKEYLDTDASAPYVGIGYIRKRRKAGKTSYQGIWCYKGMFAEDAESSETKGESINWQTPTITGRIMALDVDGSGFYSFRKKAIFTSETEAIAWLDKLANIESEAVIIAREGAAAIAKALAESTALNADAAANTAAVASKTTVAKRTAKATA